MTHERDGREQMSVAAAAESDSDRGAPLIPILGCVIDYLQIPWQVEEVLPLPALPGSISSSSR